MDDDAKQALGINAPYEIYAKAKTEMTVPSYGAQPARP